MVSVGTTARKVRLLPQVYDRHFADSRRERQFLAASSFSTTFVTTRAITHSIRRGVGPFRNITPGGRHIHHMTFGISGLIGVGYLWMLQVGTSGERRSTSRATTLTYGAAAALTLDEFALWLDLQDNYWLPAGRKSLEAVAIFGALLTMSLLGGDFVRDLHRIGRADDPEAELEQLPEPRPLAPTFMQRHLPGFAQSFDLQPPP